jgi:hypothetical protein
MPPAGTWTDERITDRFADIQRDLEKLDEVPAKLGALVENVGNLRASVTAMAAAIEARDNVMIKERQANRRALWALTGTLGAALIAGIAGVLATVLA